MDQVIRNLHNELTTLRSYKYFNMDQAIATTVSYNTLTWDKLTYVPTTVLPSDHTTITVHSSMPNASLLSAPIRVAK